MHFDRNKLRAVVLHACNACPPDRLGAVKLHKVLYFTDMLRFIDSGCSVTGSTYRKRPFGPTCVQLLPTLSDMAQRGEIEQKQVEYFGFLKTEYVAHAKPDALDLSNEEKNLLDEVISFVCHDHSAKTISEFSHQRPWDYVDFGEEISYRSAFLLLPSDVSQEALNVVEREAAGIESSGQEKDAVGLIHFADFRSRVLAASGQA